MTRRARPWAVLAAILAIAPAAPGRAVDPVRPIAQLRHTAWTLKDGAPGNIRALAQGRDGYLWLGSSTGLYRFDGVRFDHILPDRDDPRRSLQVTALMTARNGDVWVGYDFGGIAIYRDGHLRDANPWPPQGGVSAIAQSRDGAVWIAVESRGRMLLSRFADGRWTRHGPPQGYGDGAMGPILAGSDGSLYLALPPALLRRRGANAPFAPVGVAVAPFAALAEDRRHHVWLADDRGLRRLDSHAAPIPLAPVNMPYVTRHIHADRNDGLWITGQDGGLAHVRAGSDRVETMGAREGLSGKLSLSALQDREDNVWIGTETGLDRFAPAGLVRAAMDDAIVTGFVRSPGSPHMFIAGTAGIYRIDAGRDAPRLIFRKPDIGVLCGDRHALLAISLSGAVMIDIDDRGDVRRTTPVKGPLSVSCARDDRGQFWTGMDRLYRLTGNHLVPAAGTAGQPGGTITLLRADGQGGLIAARSRRGLLRIHDGVETPLLSGAPRAIGAITTIAQDGRRLILGGQKGIAQLRDGRLAMLTERVHPYLAGITGIARMADGWTWLNGATGIVRIPNQALDDAFLHPDRPIAHQRVGHEADYRARSNLFDANDIAPDDAGRIWFATDQGLAWSEPGRLARNLVTPPVVIRSLRVDGVDYPVVARQGRIILPPNSGRVQIDYTALSLTDAEENRFRYRLGKGEWFDAGRERGALYTNLSPGHYEFQVIAANNDGTWNLQGAVLPFDIAPAFYQTRWFLLLCLAIVSGLLWLAYRRRLHVVTERARQRIEAQLTERERIARELHDTLLQGFQGLMLRFQAVVELLPRGGQPRQALENTLDRAEEVLVESRERVHSLRQELQPVDLADRLRALMAQMIGDQLPWRIEEDGPRRLICAPVADEAMRIAREAISNSMRHASARTIWVHVHHDTDRMQMSVGDDGMGLPASVVDSGAREGHYGLVGMRERARRITGTLDIRSDVQAGVLVQLSVPARVAYC